jgi:hypothetical protein
MKKNHFLFLVKNPDRNELNYVILDYVFPIPAVTWQTDIHFPIFP